MQRLTDKESLAPWHPSVQSHPATQKLDVYPGLLKRFLNTLWYRDKTIFRDIEKIEYCIEKKE